MSSDFDKTYGSDPHARMVAHVGEGRPDPIEDVERNAIPGEPPVPGAQWDEVHRRWELWNEESQAWEIVGEEPGDGVAPEDENPLPPLLARELLHDEEIEKARPNEGDVDRIAEPTDGPPGAQWNEITNRWERWDEASNAWVEAS